MSHCFVLVERDAAGDPAPVTGELLTVARELGEVRAVLPAPLEEARRLAPRLGELGADIVIAAVPAEGPERLLLAEVDALSTLAAAEPGPVLVAAGPAGNEIAGRVAARCSSGVLVDVTAVRADRTAAHSIFGDSTAVDAAVGGASPVYALRRGAQRARPEARAGELRQLQLPGAGELDATVLSTIPADASGRPELTEARIVVGGGRGVGENGFAELVEPLADDLGAAVGGTRDVVDLGWCESRLQIGQTGVAIAPELYIALGISGAIQHLSGIRSARTIIAVNIDEAAPIFQVADHGVVGDVAHVVPRLREALAERR